MRLKRPAPVSIGLDLVGDVIERARAEFQPGGTAENGAAAATPKTSRGSAPANRDRTPPETAGLPAFPPKTSMLATTAALDTKGGGYRRITPKTSMVDVNPRYSFHVADAIEWLASYKFTGAELVYCDPPYMHETRGRTRRYQFEMTDAQHVELLRVIRRIPAKVMLSGYYTKLYERTLKGWRPVTFQAVNRAGKLATEWLWMNYPEPVALHDYRYLGEGYRERERIAKRKRRWVNRLKVMPLLESRALLAAIEEAGLLSGRGL